MPQDEILDGSTWTDVQPKEEILDGSTWVEPVKKKVTTPDLNSGGKTTSQSVSTSTSTSQNNVWQKTTPSKVGDTIGAFNQTKQIPVIAPTNKNVLGEGTVVAPTKEAVKPIDNPYDTSAQYIIQADNTDTGLSNVSQQAESKRVAQEAEQVQKQRELANPNSFENIGAQYKAKALNMSGNNDVEKMIKYGDVNGNMAFLSEMLDDNDKPLFETKSAIDKIDKDNKIYEQQLKSGSITPEQFDAHKKENDKKAIELNTQYVQQMQKRNSSIDDEIKQSEQKLARGYDMKMLGAQPYSVQLTKQEIDSEKKKIKQLTDLKNDVLIDINNPVKSLEKHDGYVQAEKQGLIPTNATNSQKVKIYSYILVDKAKKLATELGYNPNDVKSLIGDELGSNTPKMWWEQLKSLVVGSSDKEREYIHTMAELQAIAPIAILNKNNLTLNEGYTSNLVSSFRKSVAPLFVRNQIATDEDRNTLTKEAFNKAGVNDGVSQAYTDRQATTEKESKTLGKTVARTTGDVVGIGVKIGLINPILDIPAAGIEMAVGKPVLSGLNKALSTSKEVQALEAEALLKAGETATKASEIASIDKAKKVLDIAKVVTEKLPNNFLTRTIYNTTKAGVVHEIQGRVNKELEGFANFEVGAVNHLIGMPLNTLGKVAIRLFGKDAPAFVSQVVHAVQAGTSMTATMAGMTVVNDAKESESFDAFKEKMNEQFGTADKKLRFIAENFLLGLTMHAANISTLSGLFNANYTKLYESLKPEEKAKVDEFVKSVNEDANDFESETKDAVVEVKNDTHENKTTDEEAKNAIEYAGNINFQAKDFGAEAKQDAKIESAVIEIGGKIYEGKNHAEAILKAKADGQDISQVNRQAEGKFKLSDGTIIDRAEAKTRFGQDRSELIIPQDEAAKQANKDYAEITKGLKNEQTNQNTPEQQDNGNSTGMAGSEQNSKAVRTKSEQGKLSNEDKIQQNATTEVQKQITEVEKIISELEDNPNSPFHKLVNLDEQKQKLSELQKKEAEEGVSGSALKDVVPVFHHTKVDVKDFDFGNFQRGKNQVSQFGDGLAVSTDTTPFLQKRYGNPIKGEVKDSDFVVIDTNKTEKEIYEELKSKGYKFNKPDSGSYIGNDPAKEYNGTERANENPAIISLFNDFQKSNPEVKGVKIVNHIIANEKVSPFYVIYDNKSFYGEGSLKESEEESSSALKDVEGKKADTERRRQEELKVAKIEIPRYFTFKELGGGKGKSGKELSSVESDKNEEIQREFESKLEEGDKLIEPNGDTYFFKNNTVVKPNGRPRGMADIGAFIDGVTIDRTDKINAIYDAEYVDAVKKGEMTKEQAMQALEQAGRKGSDAYAELATLEETSGVYGSALKDVESTAKALWGVQKENADKFVNDFANIDIPFRQKNIQAEMDSEVKKQLFPNEKSRRKYAETIYSAVVRSGNFPKILSEAYHADKAAGKETELVKAVEEALSKPNTNVTTPTKEVSTSENKIKSWIDKWEELKKENDNEQLDLFYNKVKVALNGYAQGKGVVDEFTKLKSEIEQFAKERKAKTKEQGIKDEEKSLSTKKEEISSKKSIEVDRNVDRVDNNQENIETSSSKKLKTNGNIIEGYNSIFGEDIVDNKGNVVGSKISDTRPNGKKYYQTLTDDTPENRKGFGWQEHQDIDGKIFKKFETLDDLEKFIDSKKQQETPNAEVAVADVDKKENSDNGLKFRTHTGEEVSGKRLTDALNKVADDMVESANKKRKEHYASHITEQKKDEILAKDLDYAEKVRNGESIDNFTTQQRINTELTGESVPLFAPEKTENKQSLENKTGYTLTNEVTEKEKNSNAVTTPKEKEQNSQSNFTADLSDADIPTEEKVLSINANMKKYGITNDSIKSLLKNAIEKVAGLSVNNIFDIASRIAKFDKYPIRLEHIVEAIQYEVGRVEKEQDLFTISLDDIQDTILSKYKQDTPSNKARINDIGISEKTYGSRSKKLTEIKKSFELLSNEAKALASQFIKRYYDAIKDDAKFTAEEYLDLLKGIVKNKDIVGVAENIQNAIKVIEDKEAIELQKLPPVKNPLKNKENTEDALRRFTSKELNQIPLHSKQSVEKMIDDSLKKNKEARINIPLGSLYGLPDKVMSVILNKDNNVIFLDKNGKEIKAIKFDREKFNDFAFNVAKEQNKSAYSLSEAYHKAKADGSNPELVKAVEDLLGKAPTQYTEAAGGSALKDVEEDSEKWYKAKKTIKDKDGNDIKLTIDKNKDDKHFYIKATDSNGKEVGSALFETSDGEVWSGNEIEVNEANRRKGIMSAMYDFAESEGHPLEPTKTLSKEGKAFWDNRKAPTQYTEAATPKDDSAIQSGGEQKLPDQKVLFNDAIQYYKDKGLSYEEVKSRLDKNDVDYEEADLKDAWDGGKDVPPVDENKKQQSNNPKEVKKTVLTKRIYENPNEVAEFKHEIQTNYDLKRKTIPHEEALFIANDIVKKYGIDNALDAVRKKDIQGGVAQEIFYAKYKDLDAKINSTKDEGERLQLIGEKAKIASEWSDFNTTAGQQSSQMADIYKRDDGVLFNVEIQKQKYREANDGVLPKEIEEKFDALNKTIEDANKRISEIEKEKQEIEDKYKESVDKKQVDEYIKEAYEKGKKDGSAGNQQKKYTQKFNRIADAFERKFKSKPLVLRDADGNEIKLTQNAIVAWDDIIKIGSTAIRKTGEVIDGVNAIIEAIKDQDWYKNLSPNSKDAVRQQYEDYFTGQENKKKEDGLKVPSSRVKEIVEARRLDGKDTTVKDLVDELKKDFPDGTTDRVIRDAFTGYGKTSELPQGDDATVRKLRRMSRYESILEDLDNGIRPSKTGKERDTLESDERAKLKEIREGLKKLKPSDEDLSKKLKTSQDAIETRLKNRIEDLKRQIDAGKKDTRIIKPISTPDIEKMRDEVKKLEDDLDEVVSKNRHSDTLQELKDNAEISGNTTISKADVDNGLISDLVQAHIEKGTPISEVQQTIFDELKEIFPDTTEAQVRDAILKQGDFKSEPKETTALKIRLSELKTQLNLQKSIEEIQAGIIKATKEKGAQSDEVIALKKKLADAKKEALNKYPEVSAKELEKKIERTQKSIDEYKRKTAEKEFVKTQATKREFHNNAYWVKKNKELYLLQLEKAKAKAEFEREQDKLKDKEKSNTEKVGEFLGKVKRFDIFTSFFGMGRLALAAVARPLTLPLRESAKYLLSRNLPDFIRNKTGLSLPTATLMEKSAGNYRKDFAQSLRYMADYYASYFGKKIYKDAISEFNKRSNYSLEKDVKGKDRYSSFIGRILSAPEQAHGFMKAFAKLPQYNATFNVTLENMNRMIDKRTGEIYDITDPYVQSLAIKEAKREADADVFMEDSDLARANSALWSGLSKSDNYIVQLAGIYGKQLEPVIKVPVNFFSETLQGFPLVGFADAIQTIARSGDVKNKKSGGYRGMSNLTPEQAHLASRKLTNQIVGFMGIAIGMGLYKLYKDDAIKELEHIEHWAHNTSFPLIMMGLDLAKELEKEDSIGDIAKIPYKEAKKLTTALPQYRSMRDYVFTTEKSIGKRAKGLLIPTVLKELGIVKDDKEPKSTGFQKIGGGLSGSKFKKKFQKP